MKARLTIGLKSRRGVRDGAGQRRQGRDPRFKRIFSRPFMLKMGDAETEAGDPTFTTAASAHWGDRDRVASVVDRSGELRIFRVAGASPGRAAGPPALALIGRGSPADH